MREMFEISESDYLAYELMPNKNMEFVLNEFAHITTLIKNESEWQSYPEWIEYLSERPIGNKPHKINQNISELRDFLQDNDFTKIENVEIIADERGIYSDEIKFSEMYGNSIFGVVFSGQNDVIEYICIVPLDQDDLSIVDELGNSAKFILEKYNLILVNWNAQKIN